MGYLLEDGDSKLEPVGKNPVDLESLDPRLSLKLPCQQKCLLLLRVEALLVLPEDTLMLSTEVDAISNRTAIPTLANLSKKGFIIMYYLTELGSHGIKLGFHITRRNAQLHQGHSGRDPLLPAPLPTTSSARGGV